ncbi:MAG: transmembrane anchor protein [Alphaproteobacteria bacterium]|nr:transmembrane anchor protein [Alphaproteobacteria bacterium]
MFNATRPDASELPSTGQLLKSTGIAAVVASGLLVLVVLPAEYGVDPTGAGSLLGLTEMGRIKMSLAAEAEALAEAETAAETATIASDKAIDVKPPAATTSPIAVPSQQPAGTVASEETTITLSPDESYEIKLVMETGAKATYLWFTDGDKVNFDMHGDGPGIDYHHYGKGSAERAQGELTAAFTGNHGWFWRNRTDGDLKVTLRTSGDYSDVKVIE